MIGMTKEIMIKKKFRQRNRYSKYIKNHIKITDNHFCMDLISASKYVSIKLNKKIIIKRNPDNIINDYIIING